MARLFDTAADVPAFQCVALVFEGRVEHDLPNCGRVVSFLFSANDININWDLTLAININPSLRSPPTIVRAASD
jgi:hypothetical protein